MVDKKLLAPSLTTSQNKMSKHQTHYERLQVLESASIEVIRGAYKHLSQKYHPDKHPDNRLSAEKATKLINTAHYTLSDPERRKKYDANLLELRNKTTKNNYDEAEYAGSPTSKKEKASNENSSHRNWGIFRITLGVLFTIFVFSVIANTDGNSNIKTSNKPVSAIANKGSNINTSNKAGMPGGEYYNGKYFDGEFRYAEASSNPAIFTIRLENICNQNVSVALLYLTRNNRWVNVGWFNVSANKILKTGLKTSNNYLYYYATTSSPNNPPNYELKKMYNKLGYSYEFIWDRRNLSSNSNLEAINRVVKSEEFSDYADIASDEVGNIVSFNAYTLHGNSPIYLVCRPQISHSKF